jgi:hypothetical protein
MRDEKQGNGENKKRTRARARVKESSVRFSLVCKMFLLAKSAVVDLFFRRPFRASRVFSSLQRRR